MIRSLMLSLALVCAVFCASAQTSFSMELRQIITIEIDSTVNQLTDKKSNKIFKVLNPFADQKAIWQNYYVMSNVKSDAYIRKKEFTLVPIL